MICFFCTKRVAGADLRQRFEWRKGCDGLTRLYGPGAPDGNLSEAAGALVKVAHHKCRFAAGKRDQLAAARDADRPSQPPSESDWRHQDVVEVGELAGEGHRADGGAGAPDH